MALKLCPKIILEGTRLTFKTEIAFALNENPRIVGSRKYRYHSPLISAEWCAFTNYPWGRGMINFEPHEETLAMETYQTWMRLFELQHFYSWIVDRFHISTQTFQFASRNKMYDFAWLEERLKRLNFRLVFCHRSAESFSSARIERLKVSGYPPQYDNLNLFIEEQELMKKLVSASRLQTLWVDVSDNNIQSAVDKIAEWMEKTDGLYIL